MNDAEDLHKHFNNIKYDVVGSEPKAFTMSQSTTRSMLCTFCRKEYSGKPTECPHCHKLIPRIPDMLHIV